MGRAGSSPATWAGLGPARKKYIKIKFSSKLFPKKIFLKKICDFPKNFTALWSILVLFLYCKDINPILKYLVFVKKIKNKKIICFHAYGQVSQKYKKNHIIFLYNKKISKICISMHYGFNNQFIKVTRTRPIFQKNLKKLFCFLLISGVTTLYVRCIPDIKFFCWHQKYSNR